MRASGVLKYLENISEVLRAVTVKFTVLHVVTLRSLVPTRRTQRRHNQQVCNLHASEMFYNVKFHISHPHNLYP
jgi:hypothetical protein